MTIGNDQAETEGADCHVCIVTVFLPEPEDSCNYLMGRAVSSTHDLEGVEIHGIGVLGGLIYSIAHTGLPEVYLGDIPLLVSYGVVTGCIVDRIGQPEACQVVDCELTVLFSK